MSLSVVGQATIYGSFAVGVALRRCIMYKEILWQSTILPVPHFAIPHLPGIMYHVLGL